MIFNEIIDYHNKHLSQMLHDRIEAAIEYRFLMDLLQINKPVHLKLETTVAKAAKESMRDNQVYFANFRVTCSTFQSESFVVKIS